LAGFCLYPLEQLTALPRSLAGFKGAALQQEEGERKEGHGKGSWGGKGK